MQLLAWFAFPKTQCYAIVSAWIENEAIEDALFNDPILIRKYMHDLLVALTHLHSRGILYRDIKPSNVLWSTDTEHGIMIDYDVATFYDPQYLHRLAVGTDGYMAPELHVVSDRSRQSRLHTLNENDPYASLRSLKGYTQAVDAYGAGMVLGQLIFNFTEDLVADKSRVDVKGEAFLKNVHNKLIQNQPITVAEDLMCRLLCPDPSQRISVEDALRHPYFNECT
jgi:serine/threonine protein kinase